MTRHVFHPEQASVKKPEAVEITRAKKDEASADLREALCILLGLSHTADTKEILRAAQKRRTLLDKGGVDHDKTP